jgi:antitoxin component of RelBE/YafQ-DinJ toxin-antitoxin module
MHGAKKMLSLRVPELLLIELDNIAREKGWTTTTLIMTVLDQYAQQEKKSQRGK